MDIDRFKPENFKTKLPEIFAIARQSGSCDDLRTELARLAHDMMFDTFDEYDEFSGGSIMRVRDCAKVIVRMMTRRSEDRAKFSVAKAIRDIARGTARPDLTPAFFADLHYLFLGLQGRGPGKAIADHHLVPSRLRDRQAAIERSRQLDELFADVQAKLDRTVSGLGKEAIARRELRRRRILSELGGEEKQWHDWQWQVKHILRDAAAISKLLFLSGSEKKAVISARKNRLPFGITPYYASLMDDEEDRHRDRALRAQVIPAGNYVAKTVEARQSGLCQDFMLESDTSPIDLITRRYPSICILKPFNTCPQICVYCQRNWEIDDAMQAGAMASRDTIKAAVDWIAEHPAIHEVLITGGDPLAMEDGQLDEILGMVAAVPTVERIRIGTRTPVTLPMRLTGQLVSMLARYREPGRRQLSLVTHVQHPYEITPDLVEAVSRLRGAGIPVYNQLVYTFYISRRFEAAYLRRLLSLAGIDPYYTFNSKGKEETLEYRVPIARLLQEQKEEARLLPGLSRTDEAVYNVPGQGKNYLRASSFRDLISILPDGRRLYEFHPWEKNITANMTTHICRDVPILDYLLRLEAIGEDLRDYETIWYYF